jgi:hypothetical protein
MLSEQDDFKAEGVGLPFEPATLAFKDLWYSVASNTGETEKIDLLKGVSGFCQPGTMTALMGSSGGMTQASVSRRALTLVDAQLEKQLCSTCLQGAKLEEKLTE